MTITPVAIAVVADPDDDDLPIADVVVQQPVINKVIIARAAGGFCCIATLVSMILWNVYTNYPS